ncbi:MAG: hypothetical protein ACTSQE_01790 [Candidatus Heimdallarchaeaceae archaeon]
MEVIRTEVMEVGKNKELSKLCHKVKNLYNRANYIYKQHRVQQKYLSYYEMDRVMKKEQCYKVLPAHTAQQTLKLLIRNWKAFYRARKEYKKDPSRFIGPPRPPKYKKKEGETVAIFSNQQARILNGYLVLPKKVTFSIKTRLTAKHKVREVRIVPRGVGYTIEIVYKKTLPRPVTRTTRRRVGAIDLGTKNQHCCLCR